MEDLLGREDQVALVEMEVRTGLTVVQEGGRTVRVLGVAEAQKTLAEVEGRRGQTEDQVEGHHD